jgi:hypothetical protein
MTTLRKPALYIPHGGDRYPMTRAAAKTGTTIDRFNERLLPCSPILKPFGDAILNVSGDEPAVCSYRFCLIFNTGPIGYIPIRDRIVVYSVGQMFVG